MIRLPAALASAAALAMAATPASAAPLPLRPQAPAAVAGVPADAAGWGYGHYDRYDGYGYGRHHRRDRGVDAGDVIAGVLVIGAIAAIASSAQRNSRERYEESYPRRSPDTYRSERRRSDSGSDSGLDSAVDMCVEQVERGSDRVESVDSAARVADGWRVSGALSDGEGWRCWIDNDGRIRSVDFGAGYAAAESGAYVAANGAAASGQLSDDAYARARAATRSGASVAPAIDGDLATGPQPAYPGGPLPGEEGYDEAVSG